MKNAMSKIEGMTYGVELEYECISKHEAVRALEQLFGTHARYAGTYLDAWKVPMPDGREWTVENDGSLSSGCETVSPVMKIADMETVQNVVRALRRAGAKARSTCGLHIHVGAGDVTERKLVNLLKMWYVEENYIVKAFGTQASRLYNYTRPLEKTFIDRVRKDGSLTWKKLEDYYYGGRESYSRPRTSHYCNARYNTLNLHNLFGSRHGYGWAKPTIEFRLFEATTHAGEVKANILLALSVVARAKHVTHIVCDGNKKGYDGTRALAEMGAWLDKFGWHGDNFKNARAHVLKRMIAG